MTMKLKMGAGCPACMQRMKRTISDADDTSGGSMFVCKECDIRVILCWMFYDDHDKTLDQATTLDDYS